MTRVNRNIFGIVLTFVFLTSIPPAGAGLLDKAKGALEGLQGATSSSGSTTGGLASEEIINGLKEALRIGSERVISQVGQPDGYLTDNAIHIPLPENLQTVDKALKAVGMGSMTADLETRLNRAAEQAAPEAKAVFWDAISNMTLQDAEKILNGNDTAATDYFRQHMTPPLTERFTPIVDTSLSDVGAVKAYDQVMGQYKSLPFVPDVKADLTRHAVTKALDGLFYYLAAEEKKIRENPAARTTDLLKKVFSR